MKTRLKPNLPVTFFHIISRCAQQEFWLKEPAFKKIFIELLDFYSRVYHVKILAHTTVSNHFHICLAVTKPEFDEADVQRRYELAQTRVQNPRPFHAALAHRYFRRYTDLSKFMWEIKWRFSRTYNAHKDTKGAFWDGRFKSMIIQDGTYLMNCMTYIDLNPVRANLVFHPDDFKFGSITRIKEALEKEEADPTPAVGPLAQLPDGDRGRAYIALNRYLAKRTREGESKKGTIPKFLKSWIGENQLQETLELFETKSFTKWGLQVMGSESFITETLTEAGYPSYQIERIAKRRQATMPTM